MADVAMIVGGGQVGRRWTSKEAGTERDREVEREVVVERWAGGTWCLARGRARRRDHGQECAKGYQPRVIIRTKGWAKECALEEWMEERCSNQGAKVGNTMR